MKFKHAIEIIFALIALFSISYVAYTDGHKAGYKQGQFEARFECEQVNSAAVDEAVRTGGR